VNRTEKTEESIPQIMTFVATLKAWLGYARSRARADTPSPLALAKALTPVLWDLIDSLSDDDLRQLKDHCDSAVCSKETPPAYRIHPMALLEIGLLSDLQTAWDHGARVIVIRRGDTRWKVEVRSGCGFVATGESEALEGPCNATYDAVEKLEEHNTPRYQA
jgi:hypothetical protein